jgi:hypothetical protein
MRSLYIAFIAIGCLYSSIAFSRIYTFSGTGNWDDPSHWENGLIPPQHTFGSIVTINGNVTLTGNATYTCGLMVSSGSSLTIATGATLTVQYEPLSGCGGDGGLWFWGATITVQAGATFNCVDWIYDCGTLNVDGTMNCNYISNTSLNSPVTINGDLEISSAPFIMFSSPVTINNGGKLHIKSGVVFYASNTVTVNPGGLLQHEGTMKGTPTIVTSVFSNTATLSPGNSPGIMTINGDYAPTGTANHIMEIGGTAAGSYDQINVTGDVVLNGALNASLYNGFTPLTSHDIPIITANSITGTFSSLNIPAGYSVVYSTNSVALRFSSNLPVNFVNVTARREGNETIVKWEVGDEQDVNRYEIERSVDGSNFIKIGSVLATGSPNYSFKTQLARSETYYRIKSIDLNGSFKYSSTIKIDGDKGTFLLSAYPSPTRGLITIQHPISVKSKITINSIDGRNVAVLLPDPSSHQTKFDLTNLRPGAYIINYWDVDQMQTLKILKQ